MQMFQRCLVDMFDSLDMDVVFMETVMDLRRHPHSVIHCVPVSRDEGAMMPMYFKKGIQECDTQWAQNQRLIDTRKKDVRRSVSLVLVRSGATLHLLVAAKFTCASVPHRFRRGFPTST